MSRHLPFRFLGLAGVLAFTGFSGLAQQALTLPIGKTDVGTANSATPTAYEFKAATAGLLSVALQGDGDLAIVVTDEDGQTVPDGTSDRDLNGSAGAEQVLVTLTEPGTYKVQIRMLDGQSSKFTIGAAWIPFPPRARPSDPDKRPATARAIEAGKPYEDSLDTNAGDSWDWFVFTPRTAGTLTIILRPIADSKVDLELEIYATPDLTKPTIKSDQDLQGNAANESGTVDVTAGQKVYVKVGAASGGTSGKYRLSSSLIQ